MRVCRTRLVQEAKLKVFNREVGGFVLTDEPDHDIGLQAYHRAVAAVGVIPREVEMPAPARPGLIVIIGPGGYCEP
jgi:hypothetical protein